MQTIDTRTKWEKRRDVRYQKVLEDFRAVFPQAKTPNRAMVIVGDMNDLTRDGVRKILTKLGVYFPHSDNPVRL